MALCPMARDPRARDPAMGILPDGWAPWWAPSEERRGGAPGRNHSRRDPFYGSVGRGTPPQLVDQLVNHWLTKSYRSRIAINTPPTFPTRVFSARSRAPPIDSKKDPGPTQAPTTAAPKHRGAQKFFSSRTRQERITNASRTHHANPPPAASPISYPGGGSLRGSFPVPTGTTFRASAQEVQNTASSFRRAHEWRQRCGRGEGGGGEKARGSFQPPFLRVRG